MLQVQEQQEYNPVSFTETCEICYSNYDLGNLHTLRPRGICYNCWYQHIKTVITQISYKVGSEIISPFEGKDPIDVCIALKSLRKQQEKELEEFLFKKYTSFTNDIEKCPSESCDYVFTLQKCKWGGRQDQKCPKCEAVLTQSNSFDLKTLVGFIYFLFLTNKCPKCEIPIQKTTGCPHMSCPCGHQFCWYCLKDYYPFAYNIYSVHEPKQCAFIFMSKIIFTTICISGIFLTLLGNEVFQMLMGYFYAGVAYLLHTLLIDLIIAVNILVGNTLIVRFFRQKRSKFFTYLGIILACDIVIAVLLYWFDLLFQSAVIILVELTIIGVGAAIVYLIVLSYENWFKYIV